MAIKFCCILVTVPQLRSCQIHAAKDVAEQVQWYDQLAAAS